MEAPATTQSNPAEMNAALIAAISGNNLGALRGTPAQQGVQPPATPNPPAAPVAPAASVTAPPAGTTAAPAAPPAPAPPAPPVDPALNDPFLQALSGTTPSQPVWDDGAKSLFKMTYGEDDPLAYKEKVSQAFARNQLLEKEVEAGRNIADALKRIEENEPALAAAITESLAGRSGLEYVSSLPNPKILGKAGKDIGDEVLFRTYMGDKFSSEEWEAHKTGNFDAINTTKEVWEAKVKMLRPVAELLHDQRNQEHAVKHKAREQSIAQRREQQAQTLTASVAHASNDRFAKLHVNQETIEALRNGSLFTGTFLNEDGTQHIHAMTAAIKAQRYDSDVERAYKAGLAAGSQSGLQEGTVQMPNARMPGRVVPLSQEQQKDPYKQTLANVLGAH